MKWRKWPVRVDSGGSLAYRPAFTAAGLSSLVDFMI
jgi:hypothetical protein